MKVIVVQWPKFSPYHVARLRAADELLNAMGMHLVGLEIAASQTGYLWGASQEQGSFERLTLFEGEVIEQLSILRMWRRIFQALNRLSPDALVINGYSSSDSLGIIIWAYFHRCPLILMTETKEDDSPRLFWREGIKSLLVRQFRAAICAGVLHKNYLMKLGMPEERILLGIDVVDNEYFKTRSEKARSETASYAHLPGLGERDLYFLASARFIPRKNLSGLLLAYKIYLNRIQENHNQPWRLIILGDGEERANITALIHQLGLQEAVTLAGARPYQELPAYYARAAVFIHPALQEQWGLVVNEAMASGLPVLVSERCGCVPELVHSGVNGFTFDPENHNSLAELVLGCSSGKFDLHKMGLKSLEIIQDWGPDRFARGLYGAIQALQSDHS